MALELYSPTKSDVPELVQLGYDGYADDVLSQLIYSVPPSKELIAGSTQSALDEFGKNPNRTEVCVKDTNTGKLISYMEWYLIPEPKDDDWNVYKPRPSPPGWNENFFAYAAKLAWQSKIDAMGKQPYIYFQTLVTPPAYRKRGAGSMLMKALLDFQAQVNLPIYLIASPKGATLYPKFGFQEVSRYELDISATGTNEERWHLGMLLPAPEPDSPPRLPQYLNQNDIRIADIEIKPLTTLADHMAMRAIRERAFGPNELMDLCFGGQVSEGTPESRASGSFNDSSDTRHKWIGAYSSETNTLLGAAHWYFVDDPDIEHFPHGRAGWSPGTNVALAEAHFGVMKQRQKEKMKGKKYAYLCLLVVDVGMQKKGLATKLLQHTLKEVDELGWEAWLEATPDGLGLYQRLGWEVVGTMRTDLKEWGGEGVAEDAEMIRKPRKAA